jgi:hypothetical protein
MDREALAELPGRADVPNGESPPWGNQAPSASLAKYDMVPNYKSTEDYKRFVAEVIESECKVIDTLGLAKKTN